MARQFFLGCLNICLLDYEESQDSDQANCSNGMYQSNLGTHADYLECLSFAISTWMETSMDEILTPS